MDQQECEDGSSPDTVIGRSFSEEEVEAPGEEEEEEEREPREEPNQEEPRKGPKEEEKRIRHNPEVEAAVGSNSSLDTIVAVAGAPTAEPAGSPRDPPGMEEKKKRRRFGALKNSFKKEGGLFKIKRRSKANLESETSLELEPEEEEDKDGVISKEGVEHHHHNHHLQQHQQHLQQQEQERKNKTLKKKKSRNSLVRKLSLGKFRLSSEQETTRHTPEGGDSSRSQSQSSQESTSYSDSPSKIAAVRKKGHVEEEFEKCHHRPDDGPANAGKEELENNDYGGGGGGDDDKRKRKRAADKLTPSGSDRPISTVTVLQRKSPSLTIKSHFPGSLPPSGNDSLQRHPEKETQTQSQAQPELGYKCTSTLPYSISKWPAERPDAKRFEFCRKNKLTTKSESECSAVTPRSSPLELRRKLSLLEEKRAIFQRKRLDSTQDFSDATVVAVTLDDDRRTDAYQPETVAAASARAGAGHGKHNISVYKFDTFSTFEGTFDEDTGVGYLAGIEEDYAEGFDSGKQSEEYANIVQSPTGVVPNSTMTTDSAEKTRSLSQESASSQNNTPNAGVGEKREHLYKILVIGELGAGKTSIIKRYVHQFFSQHYRATIGVDFALKVLNWDPHTIIRLQLWDIAGQERFGNMTRVYYKEAVGAFIVFDVTRSATLDAVVKWKQDLDSKVQLPDGSPIPCVLLANKCDQQKEGLVNTPAKMDEYCKEKNFAGWFETSAKENVNIEEAARFLVNKILQNDQIMKGNGSQDQNDGERFALNQSPTSSKKSCSC